MLIKDSLFGTAIIKDNVLVELIKSDAVQRLKKIAQQGIPGEFLDKSVPAYSRYEHSIGCMLMLRRFGAGIEEQIAGLLHDISHMAFSHVVDGMLKNSKIMEVHDKYHTGYFINGQISEILEKYGLDPKGVGNLENFPMLEREIPDICVDRVESDLRYHYYMNENGLIENALNYLTVRNGELMFGSARAALRFSKGYLSWQPEGKGWGNRGYELTIKYYYLAKMLKHAIKSGVIERDDLKSTDKYVLDKLMHSEDKEVRYELNRLHKIRYKKAKSGGILIRQKFRYVDPKCMVNGRIKRLSSAIPSYRKMLIAARRKNRVGVRLITL